MVTLILAGNTAAAAPVNIATKKTSIAVMTLKNSAGISPGEIELLSDRLRAELFKTDMVEVMERDQMQAILKEQGFQQSGACTDEGCMVQMGQMLGVQKLVTGSIGKLGSMYMINARIIDVSSARIVVVVNRDIRGDIEGVVNSLPGVAMELVGLSAPPPKAVALAVADHSVRHEKTEEPPAEGEFICNGVLYLEKIMVSKDLVGFDITPDDLDELNDQIAEGLDEGYNGDVKVLPKAIIDAANCQSPVVRLTVNSYVKKPARMQQFEVTIKVTVNFYNGPKSASIGAVAIEKLGDRHWNDNKQCIYAFEAVGKALEDKIADTDPMKQLNRMRGK